MCSTVSCRSVGIGWWGLGGNVLWDWPKEFFPWLRLTQERIEGRRIGRSFVISQEGNLWTLLERATKETMDEVVVSTCNGACSLMMDARRWD